MFCCHNLIKVVVIIQYPNFQQLITHESTLIKNQANQEGKNFLVSTLLLAPFHDNAIYQANVKGKENVPVHMISQAHLHQSSV